MIDMFKLMTYGKKVAGIIRAKGGEAKDSPKVVYTDQKSFGSVREVSCWGCVMLSYFVAYKIFKQGSLSTLEANDLYYKCLDAKAIKNDCTVNDAGKLFETLGAKISFLGKTFQKDDYLTADFAIVERRRKDPESKYASKDGYVYHTALWSGDMKRLLYEPWPGSRTTTEGEFHLKRCVSFRG